MRFVCKQNNQPKQILTKRSQSNRSPCLVNETVFGPFCRTRWYKSKVMIMPSMGCNADSWRIGEYSLHCQVVYLPGFHMTWTDLAVMGSSTWSLQRILPQHSAPNQSSPVLFFLARFLLHGLPGVDVVEIWQIVGEWFLVGQWHLDVRKLIIAKIDDGHFLRLASTKID